MFGASIVEDANVARDVAGHLHGPHLVAGRQLAAVDVDVAVEHPDGFNGVDLVPVFREVPIAFQVVRQDDQVEVRAQGVCFDVGHFGFSFSGC